MLIRNALIKSLAVILISGTAIGMQGCASSEIKHYNPKMGLLDRLALLEPAHHYGDRMREPASDSSDEAKSVTVQDLKGAKLQWPLKNVQITSPFGQRGSEFHEGVDLRAARGTPVYAAHAGQVLYAGSQIRGYGRMIVLKSSSGIATIYAHNSKLVVRKGQWVSQGSLVAYSGNTGHSTAPHLHFEVRKGSAALDPLSILPRRSFASAKPSSRETKLARNR